VAETLEGTDSLAFVARNDIHSMTETVPLSEAPKAYARVLFGQARFRVVLDMTA
jgi:propanol-preferring alcohol dehydrogenase